MKKQNALVYIADDNKSYFCFTMLEIEDKPEFYLLHAEGNAKALYRLWKVAETEFEGKDIYFMLKHEKYFYKHCIAVDRDKDGEALFKYECKGKEQ